jgi:hypothetical protein
VHAGGRDLVVVDEQLAVGLQDAPERTASLHAVVRRRIRERYETIVRSLERSPPVMKT